MPRAAGSPTSSFELPTLTVAQLHPHPVSGHLLRKPRASGDRWHAHWRDASGRQHEKVLGKVWTRRGRPAQGYLTKQGAQVLLDELLVHARKAGPAAARRDHDVTFADAAAEWLRYVEHDRRRRPTTLRDYRRLADDVLVPIFGALPLRAITPELVDNYRAHLVAEGRLKPRTINKYLCSCYTRSSSAPSATTAWHPTPSPASTASPYDAPPSSASSAPRKSGRCVATPSSPRGSYLPRTKAVS